MGGLAANFSILGHQAPPPPPRGARALFLGFGLYRALRPVCIFHTYFTQVFADAVWIRNGTATFLNPLMAEITEDNPLPARQFRSSRKRKRFVARTMDIAEYLQRTLVRDDYVVCKMDIEGAERRVLQKLLATGAIHLIDEFFLECHYPWPACYDLFVLLRTSGVYSHEWP